ncbi:MAG TPA: hypothetical protein VN648_29200 [Candidatus Methylomirabilis sp.]|nr:hypothetical protein [Candidatus Methylomirabilis sp.]
MASRISWIGFSVGGLLGGVIRVVVVALNFPVIGGEIEMGC